MNRSYHVIAVLFVIGGLWVFAFNRNDRPRRSAKPVVTAPGDAQAPERAGGSKRSAGVAEGTKPPLPGVVPNLAGIPEHLQTPRALDPTPLALNFAGPPFERQKDGRIFKTDEILRAADLNNGDHEPDTDLQILGAVIASYRTIFRQNPVAGENREVVEALTGRNLHQLVFIGPAHPAISARHELIDRWGTPYRFHPISGTHMEISSAGADRQFGTKDDVTADEAVVIGDRGPER